MPQPLDAHSPAAIIPSQTCSKCGQQMRLTAIEPHERYKNLDKRSFACECGETLTLAVARL